MGKKLLALSTIATFVVFTLSCYSTRAIKVESGNSLEGKELKVLKLRKKSGEQFVFPEKQLAQISQGIMIGNIILKEYVVVKSDTKKIERAQKGEIIRITTKDGNSLNVASSREENEKFIVVAYEYSRIPLSEIDIIWIKKYNMLKTIGIICLGVVVFSYAIFSLGGGLNLSFTL